MRFLWSVAFEIMVILLIAVNVCEVVFLIVLRNKTQIYSSGETIGQPSGFLLNSSRFEPKQSCYLVRISSRSCPYCRQDYPLYKTLARSAEMHGCLSILIAPRTDQVEGLTVTPATVQLQYVDMAFGLKLYPFLTPSTILLDSNGRVRYSHDGAMNPLALRKALWSLR